VGLLKRGRRSLEDEFGDEMIRLVRQVLGVKAERLPDFALSIPRPGAAAVTMNLRNIYREAETLEGEARLARLRTAVLAMQPGPRPATWEEAKSRLFPALRAASWAAAAGGPGPVRRAWAPFVRLLYAIDSEHGMTFANDSDLGAWGVNQDDVERVSIDNLLHQPMPLAMGDHAALVVGPDGYVSSWLTTPSALCRVAADLGSTLIALAPARDRLLLVRLDDENAVTSALEKALADYESDPRQLSPVPYLVDEGGLVPWKPPAGHRAARIVDRAEHVLAAVEYGFQQRALLDLFSKLGEDVFVARYSLMEHPDGSVWSWSAWVRQVTDGLVPETDYLLLGDNEDKSANLCLRWSDAVALSGEALKREEGYDPPLWRHHGWPEADTLSRLRERATSFPPPP
jgi:uncharacterized protein YtpQ (UPF0354 family)